VTRGEEWISSTPIHLLVYEGLGWQPPRFAHFPLLRNTDHSKISKRKNPAARLVWFREQGFLPEALLNFLALMGWSMPEGREIFRFEDMVEHFSWERFSPVGPVFDVNKLDWLNGQYIQNLSDDAFVHRLEPYLAFRGQRESILRLAAPLKERTKRLSEVADQVSFLFDDDLGVEAAALLKQGLSAEAATEALMAAESLVRDAEPFEPPVLEAAFTAESQRRAWKVRQFFMTVRVAATGKTATPPLFDTLVAIGRDRTIARLRDAISLLRPEAM
jgi:glutamyl-tRNA synthetase